MFSLLAIDLDGTLLDGRKRISQSNIDAITRYHNSGGKVVIVTGRSPHSAGAKVEEIEKRAKIKIDYYVCFNGAYVYDNINKSVISTTLMSSSQLAYLHELARSRGLTLWMYTKTAVEHGKMMATRSLITRGFIISKRMKIILSNKLPNDEVYKVNFIAYTPPGINYLLRFMRKNMVDDFEFFKTAKWVIEVTNKGTTKGKGILQISKILKIPLAKVAAIGDSMNDLSMLKEVGFPIAPANAMREIKAAAKKIVVANNDSAVAAAIELILNEAAE